MALDLLERRKLMDRKEIAEVLNVSESTIKKKTASGEIPSVKIGRAVRYRPEDIYRYIAGNTRQIGGGDGERKI
jgi:excisionase family DNA binding protein